MRLGTLVDRGITQLAYTYDFGDDWRHTITIEAIADADPAAEYPRYIDGAGRAPPEDVGGIPGFELFLDAIADPKHEQHRELKRWHGRPFDPAHAAEDEIQTRMKELARRRALGKAGLRKAAVSHAEDPRWPRSSPEAYEASSGDPDRATGG